MDDRVAVTELAQWWNAASQEARFEKLREALHGEAQAPRYETLRLAIILAEIEAGEVEEG